MKIFWSEFSIRCLSDIYKYYSKVAGKSIAKKMKSEILNSTKYLESFPNHGQIEENLIELREGHKYVVSGNYKIIYKIIQEEILITDIFDTRQDPSRLQNAKS